MDLSALNALSPVDGRYAAASEPLRAFFSESALIRERVRVEALWFRQLADPSLNLLRAPLSAEVVARAAKLADDPGRTRRRPSR